MNLFPSRKGLGLLSFVLPSVAEVTLCRKAAQWDWDLLPEQLHLPSPPRASHKAAPGRANHKFPLYGGDSLKCGFWLLETSQPDNGAAATEVMEKHQGLAWKQFTLGGGVIPQKEYT